MAWLGVLRKITLAERLVRPVKRRAHIPDAGEQVVPSIRWRVYFPRSRALTTDESLDLYVIRFALLCWTVSGSAPAPPPSEPPDYTPFPFWFEPCLRDPYLGYTCFIIGALRRWHQSFALAPSGHYRPFCAFLPTVKGGCSLSQASRSTSFSSTDDACPTGGNGYAPRRTANTMPL